MTKKWRAADIPSLEGKRVLITGANSGIGYQTALKLVRKGACVVMASRDRGRGEAAMARIDADSPGLTELVVLDLSSLDSVRRVAEEELAKGHALDLLINNAGVMAPKTRRETADGFEVQMGTNVLGHFALTALLMPALERATQKGGSSRVVTVASIAHKRGKMNFDDVHSKKSYSPMGAYQQSKLANLLFAFELDRRLRAKGSSVMSVAAHPGVANTNLFQTGEHSSFEKSMREVAGHAIGMLLNTDAEGALPTLYAATAPDAEPGGYYGPQGVMEMRGHEVGDAQISPQAKDTAAAARLWQMCEQQTGVKFL